METNYEKSNSIEIVKYNKFDKTYYKNLLGARSMGERLTYSKQLLSYLSNKYGIPTPKLVILDKKQPYNNFNTKYGCYKVGTQVIYIWNKTARMGKEVSIKRYITTLLHQFIHHYDYHILHLSRSIHTKGFYMRLNDLETKLQK